MGQVISTNVASLNAQRNLNTSQNALNTSLERLSSGMRINSAKDDAAGLAITERFTAQIRGLNQAQRNASDGISLAQTAEGDLAAITNNLQRIRELSVQSANATNSSSDRAALQLEVAQLVSEIDRVASTSAFNGVNLLDGSFTSQDFQVGANAGETVSISSIASARSSALGASYSAVSASTANVSATALDGSNVKINGTNVIASISDGVSSVGNTYSALSKVNAINASGISGVTATVVATDLAGAGAVTAATTANGDIIINGVSIDGVAAVGTDIDATGNALVAEINTNSAATGVIATYDATGTTDKITLTATDGRNITVQTTTDGETAASLNGSATTVTETGRISVTADGNTGLTFGGTGAIIGTVGDQAASNTGTALSLVDISSVTGANTALASVDAALTTINTSRASLGAVQNRFESVVTSIQTTSENLSAARSRIRDTDFAAETASLTKAQILQQAGVAMLSQANSLPQNVLSLLQ